MVAGALVGSLAAGGGDRFSDLDLAFAVADDVPVAGSRRLDSHAERRVGRSDCRPPARPDELPGVPSAGGTPARPVADAGGTLRRGRSPVSPAVPRNRRG